MTTCEPAPNGGSRLWPTPTASLGKSRPAPWKPGVQWWLQSRASRNLAALVEQGIPLESPPEDDPQLTLFAADSPASPSAARGKGSRRLTRGGSGQPSHASFATYDPATCSWRTFRDSLDGEWETYSETWPASGMTRNGIAYRRPTSVPPIYANASGSWPTPSANQYEYEPEVWQARREREKAKGRNGNGFGLTLGMAVQMWPTPQAHDAHPGNPARVGRFGTQHGGRNLNDEVAMWPTPGARLGEARGPQAKRYSDPARSNDLDDAVAASGTPGQLNPEWVGWLMGFPAGWTDSGD